MLLESKNTATPDGKRTFERGGISVVHLAGFTVGRTRFRPGDTPGGPDA